MNPYDVHSQQDYLGIYGEDFVQASLLPEIARCQEIDKALSAIVFFKVGACYEVYEMNALRVSSRFSLEPFCRKATAGTNDDRIFTVAIPEASINRCVRELVSIGHVVALSV